MVGFQGDLTTWQLCGGSVLAKAAIRPVHCSCDVLSPRTSDSAMVGLLLPTPRTLSYLPPAQQRLLYLLQMYSLAKACKML